MYKGYTSAYIGFGTRRNEYEQALNCFELIEIKQKPASIRSIGRASYMGRVMGSSGRSKYRQKHLISCSTGRARVKRAASATEQIFQHSTYIITSIFHLNPSNNTFITSYAHIGLYWVTISNTEYTSKTKSVNQGPNRNETSSTGSGSWRQDRNLPSNNKKIETLQ